MQEVPVRYIDLNHDTFRQVIVDREEGQYMGHVSSLLLEDGKTVVCVYPKGHGRGAIVEKMSFDGGLTWTGYLRVRNVEKGIGYTHQKVTDTIPVQIIE